jgi:hypothetical protein
LKTAEIANEAKLSEEALALIREDLGPSRYVDLLESQGLFKDAIHFLTHGFPIHLTIRWGCGCSRELLSIKQIEEWKASLQAADNWLNAPGDQTRWDARNAAEKSNMSSPIDLIAMAAFFSGGSIAPPDAPATLPPPYLASKLAGGAIQMVVLAQHPEKAAERYRRTLQISREIVKGERK